MGARTISSLLASLLLAGCACQPVYVVPELPLPDGPVLPTIASGEFVWDGEQYVISRDVYERLAVRDTLRRRYADELREIIIQHNAGAE